MTSYPAGPPSLLRSINGRAVLQLIAAAGPITRTDIAARSGLSKPTVSAVLAALVERKVAVEVGQVTGRKGPAAALYQIDPGAYSALGVDIGRLRLRAAVADALGERRGHAERPTPTDAEELVRAVTELAEEVAAQAGLSLQDITQAVVGVPGVVAADGRSLNFVGGLPGQGQGLGTALEEVFGRNLVLENDINLAAAIERIAGKAQGVQDFVLIGLGGGLGVGVVLGGVLHRGASGAAGEAGSLPSPYEGPSPAQGPVQRELVDDVIGTDRIMAQAVRRGLIGLASPVEVFALARQGDERALGVVDDTAHTLAYVIACIVPVLDPELIVLGGAVGANDDLLLEPVQRHLATLSPFAPTIVTSDLGSRAVLEGALAQAAALARDRAFEAATSFGGD